MIRKHIFLTLELIDLTDRIKVRYGVTLAALVRLALVEYIERHYGEVASE